MTNILDLFARPIAFHPVLVPATGSINAALMLSQAIYWTPRATLPDGWFYKTQAEWQLETGMTRREQDGARKLLSERGFIKEEKRGVPSKLHYQVQHSALEKVLLPYAPNRQTECTKPPSLVGGKRQTNTETTAEITAEKTSAPSDAPRLELVPMEPKSTSDIRYVGCVAACKGYADRNGVVFQWGAAAGKQLKALLKSAPTLTVERFEHCLANRARSPVPHGDPPQKWLGELLKYQQGPLDRFGKPEAMHGASEGKSGAVGVGNNRAQQRTEGNVDAARRAYASLSEGAGLAG